MCYKGMAYRGYLLPPVDFLSGVQTRSKFYQHFTSAFFTRKCFAQLFSNYSLALWLFGKRISVKKLLVTCWWNWLQVSIPSTFYEKLFYTKVLSLAFLFCFYFIGKRKTGKKAACKMLVKLTDIACQVFSEKIMFRNCKTSETIERSFEGWKKFQNKLTRLLICSILESRYQFHQSFTGAFFERKFFQSQTQSREKTFVPKIHEFNIDEIDHRRESPIQTSQCFGQR